MTGDALSPTQTRDLRHLAATIIPASAAYGVPGADDDAIFADILANLGRDRDDVTAALDQLAALSDGSFADLAGERRADVAATFRARGGGPLAALVRVIMLCYYRDDRVMRSLGQEPRAPFPKGHVVEQGDWSLLDPVRARPSIYRRVP
jgi:hypothetical protein